MKMDYKVEARVNGGDWATVAQFNRGDDATAFAAHYQHRNRAEYARVVGPIGPYWDKDEQGAFMALVS